MTDLIEKIGRFFAEQEAQIQETLSQVTHAPTHDSLPLSEPQAPVHRIPTHSPDFSRGTSVSNPAPKLARNNSLIRRRLSVNRAAEPIATSESQNLQESIAQLLNTTQPIKTHDGSSLRPSIPTRPLPFDEIWDHRHSNESVSWRPVSSPPSTISGRGSSVRDEELASHTSSDAPEKQRKPRPPHQKLRKRPRKKKRSSNQEEDPKVMAKANAEKVAAALTLAQERAKRYQYERLQLERELELERQVAAFRRQEQMTKIEEVRARSFRQCSSSPMTTARSSLSNTESNYDEPVWTADTNDLEPQQNSSSQFMVELEAQLQEKMSLELHVKQSYIRKCKQRERIRSKLDKILQHNVAQSSKVARLAALKASLDVELAAVLNETAQTRQERRDLELADEKERLKRQREVERALQIRLREEEWNSMMEEEKARSQIAAEARAKAYRRVEAHSAKLRRVLRYHPHQFSCSSVSSSGKSNNDDHNNDESNESSTDVNTAQPFKMDFFLPPELADFEEDGLCNNNEDEDEVNGNNESLEDSSNCTTMDVSFKWEISDVDPDKFQTVLLGLVSDDED
ncbi:hypothetical protein PHMEG_0002792 [Phytophthora megakarya]|uniref:Uncharacterized protein n=1 Tax=Phytophthora megakarya TaxID=4795 RepID=A0A225WXN7_9STRA|nr:hypothetical protein PHMEG_0002792 [Phytophthora megakarya]